MNGPSRSGSVVVDVETPSDQIVVEWERELCLHVASCLRGLPEVFDAAARPWVRVDAASADKIAEVIPGCGDGSGRRCGAFHGA